MTFECGICGSRQESPKVLCPVTLGHGSKYDLIECETCRTRSLDPLPTDDELARFYSAEYYGGDWYKQRGFGMAFARRYLPKRSDASFLEVGASLGYFLDGIRAGSGWQVIGTELGPESVEHARKELDIELRQGELVDIDFGGRKFDFIRINNVLEHVRGPKELLNKCRELITEDGTLHLTVPNGPVDSQALLNFFESEGRAPRSKDGHLFFFPADTLVRMLDEAGFEIVSAKTLGIRRGLRTLGRYPQKKNWKRPYFSSEGVSEQQPAIRLAPEKRRPDLYYRFRRFLLAARMIPGFRSFGLDFTIFAKPSSANRNV